MAAESVPGVTAVCVVHHGDSANPALQERLRDLVFSYCCFRGTLLTYIKLS